MHVLDHSEAFVPEVQFVIELECGVVQFIVVPEESLQPLWSQPYRNLLIGQIPSLSLIVSRGLRGCLHVV